MYKILYVDDNEEICSIAEMCLGLSAEIEARTCTSGQEAIQICLEWRPDLVLMDVMMPGIDGITAFKIMQEKPEIADVPLVFVTARVQPSEIREYMDLGARGVIEKPFSPMELADQAMGFIR